MANIRFETIKGKRGFWQVFNGKLLIGRARERGESFQVDLGRAVTGGKRQQKSFGTKQAAAAWIENTLADFQEHGKEAFSFTSEQRRVCLAALAELKDFPSAALIDAAKFYREYNDPKNERRTVKELLAEFLESKKASGKASDTLADYGTRLGGFAKEHGGAYVHTITAKTLDKWLNRFGGLNRNNYKRSLVVFFNYGMKRQYCRNNPATAVEGVKIKRGLPVILHADEVTRLLRIAKAEKHAAKILPYLCLGIFAGLRPDEITRLEWRNVNFEKREIYIAHDATKTADDRYVRMSENLVEWLLPYRKQTGLIAFSRGLFDKVRDTATVTWANDVMRHTYASHHCPIHGTDETADQLGHKGKSMLFKHYRRAVSEADAVRFWAISPQEGKIVQMTQATA